MACHSSPQSEALRLLQHCGKCLDAGGQKCKSRYDGRIEAVKSIAHEVAIWNGQEMVRVRQLDQRDRVYVLSGNNSLQVSKQSPTLEAAPIFWEARLTHWWDHLGERHQHRFGCRVISLRAR